VKKLSVIFLSRNDGYRGNLLERMETSIRSLELVLDGLDWELVLVDYNPPPKNKRLSSVFTQSFIKHVVVEPEQHIDYINKYFDAGSRLRNVKTGKKVSKKVVLENYHFLALLAFREGLKRSVGTYILATSIDNIFDLRLRSLVNELEPNIVYRVWKRVLAPADAIGQFDKIVNCQKYKTPKPMQKINNIKRSIYKSIGDFLLADKKSWEEIGGYVPICHYRPLKCDGQALFHFLAAGKTIYCPELFFVNMHIGVNKTTISDSKHVNYTIDNVNGNYDHHQELETLSYRVFEKKFSVKENIYNGKSYSMDISNGMKRVKEIKNLFDSFL